MRHGTLRGKMTERAVSPSEEDSRAPRAPWIHRTARGVETGEEIPTGSVESAIQALGSAARLGWSLRGTFWVLVAKDFKGRYRAQSLGLFWSLAHPLVMMVTLTVAFQWILRVQIPSFPVFYLIGAIFWQLFTNALLATTGSLLENGGLIKHTTFPRFLFPISTVFSHLIPFGMEMMLVFAFFSVLPSAYHFNATLVALPLLVLLLVILLVGMGLIASVLNVRYRDLYYVLTSILTIGFWVTPILYSTAMAPERLRPLLRLNPIGCIIEIARDIIMNGRWPRADYLAPVAVEALAIFFLGAFVFRRQGLHIADYV